MDAKTKLIVAELRNDPTSKGYAGMTAVQAAEAGSIANRPVNKTSMTGDEMFSHTNATEYTLLTDLQKLQWISFCGRETIDPFGAANVAFVQSLFAGGATIASLSAARRRNVTRWEEIGAGVVRAGNIEEARRFLA